jgi:hypothetical protein
MPKTLFSFLYGGSSAAAAALVFTWCSLSLAFSGPAAEGGDDTLLQASDSVIRTKINATPDPVELFSRLGSAAPLEKRQAKKDSAGASSSPSDSFDIESGFYFCGGIGLSIGGAQSFTLWKNGLPTRLSDFGLSDTSFMRAGGPGDTLKVTFLSKKKPDVYNMMFPLSIGAGRFAGRHRYAASVSFSMLSKDSRSYVDIGTNADTTGRRIDITQSMALYAITLDLQYGRTISGRFFTISNSDRTDFIAGVSVSPFIGLYRKSGTGAVPDSAKEPRLWALRDSVVRSLNSVSASGISLGWRLGIAKIRRLSKKGGLEGRLCWCGAWSTGFSKLNGTLTEKEISMKSGTPDRELSYFSNRFEISIALIRKL